MTLGEAPSTRLMATHELGAGEGWSAGDCLCRAGPQDPIFSEQYQYASVALVSAGTFTYRSRQGTALLAPGSVLLINPDAEYECHHDDGVGDRCISFRISPVFLQEVAEMLRVPRCDFATCRLAPLPGLMPLAAALLEQASRPNPMRLEELAIQLISFALAAKLCRPIRGLGKPLEVDRTAVAVRYIASHYAEPLSLRELADRAGLSRFHFLRLFRNTVGTTPYQYLLLTRLREVANRLRGRTGTVTGAALSCGFSDLSEFSRRFKGAFGVMPSEYQRGLGSADVLQGVVRISGQPLTGRKGFGRIAQR